jgi:uncharacterized protein (DUF2342 family)
MLKGGYIQHLKAVAEDVPDFLRFVCVPCGEDQERLFGHAGWISRFFGLCQEI